MSMMPAISFAETARELVLDVPSGQPVDMHEVLTDRVGDEVWVRFRFLAPWIARSGGSIGFAEAEPDLEHLCKAVALPYLAEHALAADIVSITLLDREP